MPALRDNCPSTIVMHGDFMLLIHATDVLYLGSLLVRLLNARWVMVKMLGGHLQSCQGASSIIDSEDEISLQLRYYIR